MMDHRLLSWAWLAQSLLLTAVVVAYAEPAGAQAAGSCVEQTGGVSVVVEAYSTARERVVGVRSNELVLTPVGPRPLTETVTAKANHIFLDLTVQLRGVTSLTVDDIAIMRRGQTSGHGPIRMYCADQTIACHVVNAEAHRDGVYRPRRPRGDIFRMLFEVPDVSLHQLNLVIDKQPLGSISCLTRDVQRS